MRILLFSLMLTLVLRVRDSAPRHFNDRPCERNNDNNAYNTFVRKHILSERFPRNSMTQWRRYLERKRLCGRTRGPQSFMEKRDEGRVEGICNGSGKPLARGNRGNLCISRSTFHVYNVWSHRRTNGSCRVSQLQNNRTYVVVACDVVVNRCLPVHFEKYDGQRANETAAPCRPRGG